MLNQISLFAANTKGALSKITGGLAQSDVNIYTMLATDSAEFGIVRLIVDNTDAATAILLNAGYVISATAVQVISVPNQPGGLASVLAILAENSIAIEYMYSLFTHRDGKAYMVFRVSEGDRFIALMNAHSIDVVDVNVLGIQ